MEDIKAIVSNAREIRPCLVPSAPGLFHPGEALFRRRHLQETNRC
jgi:hypothetical protein